MAPNAKSWGAVFYEPLAKAPDYDELFRQAIFLLQCMSPLMAQSGHCHLLIDVRFRG